MSICHSSKPVVAIIGTTVEVLADGRSGRCLEWEVTHGAFLGMDIRGHGATKEERRKEMKTRMIESMQVQVKYAGWKPDQAEILRVEV